MSHSRVPKITASFTAVFLTLLLVLCATAQTSSKPFNFTTVGWDTNATQLSTSTTDSTRASSTELSTTPTEGTTTESFDSVPASPYPEGVTGEHTSAQGLQQAFDWGDPFNDTGDIDLTISDLDESAPAGYRSNLSQIGLNEWPNDPYAPRRRLLSVTTPTAAGGAGGCYNTTGKTVLAILHHVYSLGEETCTSHKFTQIVNAFGMLEESDALVWIMAALVVIMWACIVAKMLAPPPSWMFIDAACFLARSAFSCFAFLFLAVGLIVIVDRHPVWVWLPTAITLALIVTLVLLRVALVVRGRTFKAFIPSVNAVLTSSAFEKPITAYSTFPKHTAGVFDVENGIFYCMGGKCKASNLPGAFSCKTITSKYAYAGSTVSSDPTQPQFKVVLYSRSAKFSPVGAVSAAHALKGLMTANKPKQTETTLYSRLLEAAEAEDV